MAVVLMLLLLSLWYGPAFRKEELRRRRDDAQAKGDLKSLELAQQELDELEARYKEAVEVGPVLSPFC